MKKSRDIRLVLLGSAAVALAACGEDPLPPDAKFVSDIRECSALYSQSDCQAAESQAQKKLESEGPKYSRKEECEAEFGVGNCETRQATGGGSYFMPLLMGYMMGNMLGGGNRFASPVFRGPDNTAVTPNRGQLYNVGRFGGAVGGSSRPTFQASASPQPVARGGFGGNAGAYRTSGGG